eukprot:scaffold136145_cov26-Tisochrysis_lutea.AAC.1
MVANQTREARRSSGVAFATAFMTCHARIQLCRAFHTWIRSGNSLLLEGTFDAASGKDEEAQEH